MQSVGIYEAKSRFSALIELVEQGEEVRITRHGKEVVRMLPVRRRPVITDEQIARELRTLGKKVYLAANKVDGVHAEAALVEFYKLGMGEPMQVAASHGMVIQHERDETINITADKTRTRQILFNLVSNAVKYASSGGYVALSYQQLGSMVRIIVSDSGAGISQSHQLYVFQPFQRLGAENTTTEGSGIGLAICKQLAEAMNGHIGFESKEGVGSHFWVELPAAAVALSAESRCIAENLPLPPKNILGKVIYIEDNPVNLNVMRHLFKSIPNVELLTAHNAEKGLVMIRGNLPDMILMDIGLPGISGLDALKILKSDLRTAEIPVIAISGLAMPSHIKEGIAAGFSAYHTKPFDVSVLLAQIKLFLTLNKKTALP